MSQTYLRKLILSGRLSEVRHFHASPRRAGLALPLSDSPPSTTSASNPKEVIFNQRCQDIRSLLSLPRPSPGRVWGSYVELLHLLGAENLPLDIHQSVLRKCTPPAAHVRAAAMRRIAEGQRLRQDHIYELRFQTVIRNIRSSGLTPTLDDYHFILEQFASVGHYVGAFQVLREMTRAKLPKNTKTYGLCLQALCHRLALPIWHEKREGLVEDVTKYCVELINEMSRKGVPFTSVNVDLAVRVLKETADFEGFEKIMKGAYGIDLSYPDRPPLEYWDKKSNDVAVAESATVRIPDPLPFSTAALNTAVDMIGRLGNVSKLVQMFEVLTTPLPLSVQKLSTSTSFDDEDEDDYGISNPQVAPYRPPSAEPNTYTYHLLLKWISQAGHAVFLRHYLLQAMELDRREDRRLRGDCLIKQPGEIHALRFSVNRNMLLAVFSEANRDKNMELLRWVLVKTERVMRRKKADIAYYTATQQKWGENSVPRYSQGIDDDAASEDLDVGTSSSSFATFFSPSSSAKEDAIMKTAHIPPTPPFNADLDAPPQPSKEPTRLFDIDMHLSILERDLLMISQFYGHVQDVMGRNTQRIKERLGRRVWGGRDIYMHDKGVREVYIDHTNASIYQLIYCDSESMGWMAGLLACTTHYDEEIAHIGPH
ncbi:hypothetical protein A0H81_03558 [Grifola frondosa]|uniref:Uncharacterized protein n=1 Tax=Grifola frondosa TaxID=5627 RepID=A0A1C7MHS6_GRIFR|nr:hypothetical protein A0H81_03558 [Grifola frondosa]